MNVGDYIVPPPPPIYKSVLGLTSERSYPSIFYGNKVIADDADKAESFNNVCVEKSRIDGINRELPNVIIPTDIPVLENINMTEQDVAGQLSSVNISKSYGPDGLGPRLLKELKPVIVEALQKMSLARNCSTSMETCNCGSDS